MSPEAGPGAAPQEPSLPQAHSLGAGAVATTDRLRLRAPAPHDQDALHALLSEQDVWQAFDRPAAPTEDETAANSAGMISGDSSLGDQAQRHAVIIEELELGAFVGILDLTSIGDLGNFTVAISPDLRRHHYAQEAIPPFFNWCAAEHGVTTIVGVAKASNEASIGLMQAVGMIETNEGAANLLGNPVEVRTFEWKAP